MKLILIVAYTTFLYSNLYAQVSSYGLEGKKVTSIREYNKVLYAGTVNDGIFQRASSDTIWKYIGLEGKNIRTVYPHKADESGFTIAAGVKPDLAAGDSTFIYGYTGVGWIPSDSGIDKSYLLGINKIDGYVTLSGKLVNFALSENGPVYRSMNNIWYVCNHYSLYGFDVDISSLGTIWLSLMPNWAWIQPLLCNSTDFGDTWECVHDSSVENMPYIESLALNPSDQNIIYGGSVGGIWETTNSGITWDTILVRCCDCYFTAIAVNPFNPDQLFAGAYCRENGGDSGRIFETSNGGSTWEEIILPVDVKGIKDLEIRFRDSLELFVATNGSGIYRLTRPSDVFSIEVDSGWNMISVPNIISDYSKNSLFPNAISDAFIYTGSYAQKDTLENGGGYWIKFKDSGFHYFTGEEINTDTIIVHAGWNIIGSISKPVKTSDIITDPPGIMTEWHFYGYDGDYFEIQTIEPGYAYWVKVNQNGKLILSVSLK